MGERRLGPEGARRCRLATHLPAAQGNGCLLRGPPEAGPRSGEKVVVAAVIVVGDSHIRGFSRQGLCRPVPSIDGVQEHGSQHQSAHDPHDVTTSTAAHILSVSIHHEALR